MSFCNDNDLHQWEDDTDLRDLQSQLATMTERAERAERDTLRILAILNKGYVDWCNSDSQGGFVLFYSAYLEVKKMILETTPKT